MKRFIFTLAIIITAGWVTTAYSQISIHASIHLGGRSGGYVKQAPVVYEPVCPPPAPVCYDNGYNRSRIDVVIGNPNYDRRYYEHKQEIRYNERERNYRDRDYRDRDRRDAGHDRDGGRNR